MKTVFAQVAAVSCIFSSAWAVRVSIEHEFLGADSCLPLSETSEKCQADASWAFNDGKWKSWATEAYGSIDASSLTSATIGDFQKLFYCGMEQQCAPPCECTNPPCDLCRGVAPPADNQDPQQVAGYLNKLYFGFKENDAASPVGVTLSMDDELVLYCETPCFKAWADCRMSASVYNHRVMLTNDGLNHVKVTMNRQTGFIFNQTLVESKLGKCSFMFDGATFDRRNGGCGCNAGGKSCDDPRSAYRNMCKASSSESGSRECTVEDKEVNRCACDSKTSLPDKSDQIQCFFKGAGIDRNNVSTANDQTRLMIKERIKRQSTTSSHGHQLELWNEIVIDGKLVKEELKLDPNHVITAFVHTAGHGRHGAERMRDDFVKTWGITREIPILVFDPNVDVTQGGEVFKVDALR